MLIHCEPNHCIIIHWTYTGGTQRLHFNKKHHFVKKTSSFTFKGKSPVFIGVSEGEGC